MLNEEKVIMMTRMASYEKGKGKEHLHKGSFFRSDYIALALIKAVLSITISFIFVVAIYIYYNYEKYMEQINELDFVAIGKQIGHYYIFALIIYVAISYLVCNAEYIVARVNLGKYKSNLKKLRKLNRAQKEEE